MATLIPAWFDYTTYMNNKVAQMQVKNPTYSVTDLVNDFNKAGFGGEEGAYNHFVQFGAGEDVAPNAYFNAKEYYVAKAVQYYNVEKGMTNVTAANITELQVAEVTNLIKGAGMNAWTHYEQYGSGEGVNPANAFDASDYCAAKAAAMNANGEKINGKDWTGQDVADAIKAANMSVLDHFLQYAGNGSASEITAAQKTAGFPVPDDQKVIPLNPGTTYTLTAGIDTYTGTSANDIFNAKQTDTGTATFSTLDNLDGGDGIDTLNIVQATAVKTITDAAGATVKNIENVNITSGSTVTADTSAWTGVTQLNVAAVGAAAVTAATTTGVSINATAGVTVIGGGKVGAVTTGTGAIKIGDAAGGAANANAFTSVSIKGGSTASSVTDNSGTNGAIGAKLTAVTVDGTAAAVTLTGNAIADVTIKNGVAATAVTVTNASTADQTLNLALDNNISSTVTDTTAKAVNVTAAGKASTVALSIAGATALTTAGAADLTLASMGASYTALKTLTVNNTGAFTADVTVATALTAINASASAGANTISMDATKATYTGGSGVDTVTITATPTKAIDGGAGTADVINLKGAGATLLTADSAKMITNFEVLSATGGQGAYDVSLLKGITSLTQGALAGNVTYNNVAAGTGLTITDTNTSTTNYTLANALGSADILNLTVKSDAVVSTGAITANGIETINVSSIDTDTTQHQNTVNVTSNALKSVVITGNAGVALTNTDTTVTSVDASALSLTGTVAANGGFSWTSGAVTDNLVVKGSATGGDHIDVSAAATAGKTVAITTYAGTNTITGSALVDTITGGTGADTIKGGAGNDVIVGGGGADVITGGAGADKITISGNTATITIAAANDSGTNTATETQTSELTSSFDVITGATAGIKIDLSAIKASATNLVLNGSNLAGQDDKVVFATGTYDAATGAFTYAANGHDTVVTYDTASGTSTAYESIILVGCVAGAETVMTGGVITLA